jgi:putative ABC transport system ATP-binding protein
MSLPLQPVETANAISWAVRCHSVTKTYGHGNAAVQALRGVNLEARVGELLMLVGPSGCGKTTLISILAGVLDRDGGECSVFGQDYTRMKPADITRFRAKNIGFVFQSFNLIPALTAAENVATPLIINRVNLHRAVEQATGVLERIGFDERMTRSMPLDLSGGQQQRVAIARAFVHNPRLIVCDEPTSALDGETGQKVMELLKRVAVGTDRALIVVTHDARIFSFADRIARMEDGKIVGVVSAEEHLHEISKTS